MRADRKKIELIMARTGKRRKDLEIMKEEETC